jgi:hypothetical protein
MDNVYSQTTRHRTTQKPFNNSIKKNGPRFLYDRLVCLLNQHPFYYSLTRK